MTVVDLPDPLQSTPSISVGGTDDLLAQMAGEEIDRLLAEADVEIKPPTPRNEPVTPPQDGAASSSALAEASLSAELDRVLDTISPTEPSPSPAASAPSGPASASPLQITELRGATNASTRSAADPHSEDPETSAAERAALELPAESVAAADDEPAAFDEADANGQLPMYLRPLEWLNAPMASCSEPTRDAIGKVAILTLVNAIAVLAYVLFFRRH